MKRTVLTLLLIASWIAIAWILDYQRRERQAAFNSCVEQSQRALDMARECDDALEWCLGALRTGPRVEL